MNVIEKMLFMKSTLAVISLTLLLASCDRPECKNSNPVFDKYAPESNEYKAELIKQLKKAASDKVKYWIFRYIEKDSVEYMSVHIQGGGICAIGIFDISNAEGLGNYKKVKGMSYSGAELSGFVYKIDSSNGSYNFIFQDVVWIVD